MLCNIGVKQVFDSHSTNPYIIKLQRCLVFPEQQSEWAKGEGTEEGGLMNNNAL